MQRWPIAVEILHLPITVLQMVRSQSKQRNAQRNGRATKGNKSHHKLARIAVLALHKALAANRQHPGEPDLWRPARRLAIDAIGQATEAGPLVIELRAGSVYLGADAVLPYHREEPPFGVLRRAGIGELTVGQGLPRTARNELLTQLTAMANSLNVDQELAALLNISQVPGVNLRACADLAGDEQDNRHRWDKLPQPVASSVAVRAMIERDCSSNLLALASRQLVDDLDQEATDNPQGTATAAAVPGRIISRMMQRALASDDVATATWLLTEAERRPVFSDAIKADLLEAARRHCSVEWLEAMLNRSDTDQLLQVSSLTIQLGSDFTARFAYAATTGAHPLSRWLCDLLGHPWAKPQAESPPLS